MFDTVLCIEDTENRKPHPEPLHKALKQLGGTPQAAIMIGDTDKDICAAKNAGVDSALFYPPEHREFYDINSLLDHNPTYVINDFKNLVSLCGSSNL